MAKAKLKTQKTAASVDAFLRKLADPVQRADSVVVIKMMEKATKAPPKMWGPAIIGFGDRVLKYDSGRELDWFDIGFSPRKGALSLYGMKGSKRADTLMAKLGKHSTGKGCVYIKRLSDVNTGALQQLIEEAAKKG
jgi:hypothetical protein